MQAEARRLQESPTSWGLCKKQTNKKNPATETGVQKAEDPGEENGKEIVFSV